MVTGVLTRMGLYLHSSKARTAVHYLFISVLDVVSNGTLHIFVDIVFLIFIFPFPVHREGQARREKH